MNLKISPLSIWSIVAFSVGRNCESLNDICFDLLLNGAIQYLSRRLQRCTVHNFYTWATAARAQALNEREENLISL